MFTKIPWSKKNMSGRGIASTNSLFSVAKPEDIAQEYDLTSKFEGFDSVSQRQNELDIEMLIRSRLGYEFIASVGEAEVEPLYSMILRILSNSKKEVPQELLNQYQWGNYRSFFSHEMIAPLVYCIIDKDPLLSHEYMENVLAKFKTLSASSRYNDEVICGKYHFIESSLSDLTTTDTGTDTCYNLMFPDEMEDQHIKNLSKHRIKNMRKIPIKHKLLKKHQRKKAKEKQKPKITPVKDVSESE